MILKRERRRSGERKRPRRLLGGGGGGGGVPGRVEAFDGLLVVSPVAWVVVLAVLTSAAEGALHVCGEDVANSFPDHRVFGPGGSD